MEGKDQFQRRHRGLLIHSGGMAVKQAKEKYDLRHGTEKRVNKEERFAVADHGGVLWDTV